MSTVKSGTTRPSFPEVAAAALLISGVGTAGADPAFSIVLTPSPAAAGNIFNAVAPVGANDVWALGFRNSSNLNDARTLAEHWNGQAWSVVPTPNPGTTPNCSNSNTGNAFNAVAALSTINLWAVGFDFGCTALLKPMIQHWNGTQWSTVSSPALRTNDNAALNGIAARGANDIYAVGYQPAVNGAVQTLIEHWNGQRWVALAAPNVSTTGNVLNAVTATPAGDLWAVGDSVDEPTTSVQTLVLHSTDGQHWTAVPSPNPLPKSFLEQNVLLAVAATAANDVTAVGFILDTANQRRLTLIEHWDGTSWQVVTSPNISSSAGSLNVLTSVSAFSGGLYAAGYFADGTTGNSFTALIERFDGSNWSIVSSPAAGHGSQLFGITSVPGTTDLWGVGAFSTTGTDNESGLLIVPKSLAIFSPEQ